MANCTFNISYFCFKLIIHSSLVTAWSNSNLGLPLVFSLSIQRQSIFSDVMFTIHSRTIHLCQVKLCRVQKPKIFKGVYLIIKTSFMTKKPETIFLPVFIQAANFLF